MLGVSAVLLGDDTLKVSTAWMASGFFCYVLPQTASPLQARSIILKDWLHNFFDAASVFNISIPASLRAALNARWSATVQRTAASKTMFPPWQIALTAGFTILHFTIQATAGIRSVLCMVTDHGSADDDVAAAGAIIVVIVVVVIIVVVVVVGVVVVVVARALSFLFL
jgi:hypothetical protein